MQKLDNADIEQTHPEHYIDPFRTNDETLFLETGN